LDFEVTQQRRRVYREREFNGGQGLPYAREEESYGDGKRKSVFYLRQ
jgi:hypothetical protein